VYLSSRDKSDFLGLKNSLILRWERVELDPELIALIACPTLRLDFEVCGSG
jgi:hypothetical protein